MDKEEIILDLRHEVDGSNFSIAGEASSDIKNTLRKIGVDPEIVRKVAIAMYEGEINMVIHANGGIIETQVTPSYIKMTLTDTGPGIPNIDNAMKEGFSTATDQVRNLGFGAGMGLPNMKKYTDEMTITSTVGKGTTLEMTVNIPEK